jgi:hypothetical protein
LKDALEDGEAGMFLSETELEQFKGSLESFASVTDFD